jgi:shikimate dehydrogenase
MNRASLTDLNYLPWGLTDKINSADLIINTTPLNTAEYFLPSISAPKGVLFEVLYDPWPTQLSRVWAESGARVIDGLELLIHQAISQVEIFSHGVVDRKELHQLMRSAAVMKLG